MIKPTNGRVVLFTPSNHLDDGFVYHGQPLAATVTHVWHDRMVNLVVHDANGVSWPKTSVTLLQDQDQTPAYGYFAEWMPYQVGQAKKHEAA